MIRVRQVKVAVGQESNLKNEVATKLKIQPSDILTLKINKKSLDARRKNDLHYVYEVDITVKNEKNLLKQKDVLITPNEKYNFKITGTQQLKNRIVIVGSGPAGLFCAYSLVHNGYKPLIIERGEKIEDRVKTVNHFWETGELNLNSNVQFGEGGAGTFSDGKLNTLVKDKSYRNKKVLETFAKNGAPQEILYLNKPHIGTDLLQEVIINMRNEIIKHGGEFRYNTCLTNIFTENDHLSAIEINNQEKIICENLVLAVGHSARDTFQMLYDNKLQMEAKPFAVGIRIEHLQAMIDKNQYGTLSSDLPKAEYKLTYTTAKKRGVYSFCMCPGGYVVNASSEPGKLAINGMSNHARDTKNSNSAIIVTVFPKDFGSHPLAGITYQRTLEQKAFQLANGKIPIQLFGDFLNNKISTKFGKIEPLFKGKYQFADLNELYPDYIKESLKEAILNFDKKIKGFANHDAIIAGVESRTSSPVRIIRNEQFEANIAGIYPCGEGAGYAGGITTSAMDGLKVAEAISSKFKVDFNP